MTFWSGNPAAPTLWTSHSPFTDRRPRFLRLTQPPVPPISWKGRGAIKRLFGTQSDHVAAFLSANYCGSDWRLSEAELWIRSYLRDPDVVALGYFEESDASGRLLGILFGVPLSSIQTSNGGSFQNAMVVEGLCVHKDLRGQGLAGFLLAHLDSFVALTKGQCAFFYSREIDSIPFVSTALCSDLYAYKKCGTHYGVGEPHLQKMPWHEFERLWISNALGWAALSSEPCIVSLTPSNLRNDLQVFVHNKLVVVVSYTRRITLTTREPIYEVQWCGRLSDDGTRLFPSSSTLDFKQCLDGVASTLEHGILFVCGAVAGCFVSSWDGWTHGTSGAHAWYIYNYMPPAFGTCRIHMIRSEL